VLKAVKVPTIREKVFDCGVEIRFEKFVGFVPEQFGHQVREIEVVLELRKVGEVTEKMAAAKDGEF
jgi:predicted component of type VI protein secretion system